MAFLQQPVNAQESPVLLSCPTFVMDTEILPDTSNYIESNLSVKEGNGCTDAAVKRFEDNTKADVTSESHGASLPPLSHIVISSLEENDITKTIDGTKMNNQIVIILNNELPKGCLLTTFKCQDCNEVFDCQTDLNTHKLTHNNQIEICDECSLHFCTPLLLKRHKKFHANNRQFKCDISNSLFREKSSLKYHKLKHSTELPFSCHICCHRLTTKDELKEHLKTHGISMSNKKVATKKKLKKLVKELDKFIEETEEALSSGTKISSTSLRNPTVETENNIFDNETKDCEGPINKINILNESNSQSGSKQPNLGEKISDLFSVEQTLENAEEITTEKITAAKVKSNTKPIEKPHQCKTCFRRYSKKFYLTIHERKHTGEKPYICEICNFRTTDKSSLNNHKVKHSNDRPHACDSCELKFKLKHHLINHKLTHSQEMQFTCDLCGWSTRRSTHFNAHKRNHLFQESPSIDSNMKSGDKVRQVDRNGGLYKCNICDKVFNSKHGMLIHKRYVHLKDLPHLCDICGIKSRSQAQLKIHKLTHTGEKRFKCQYCEYSCILKTALQQHERRHTGERPYQCDTCGKTFRLESHLKNHTRVHTRERPHKCDQCDADFRQISALVLHKTTHTTEKPFACDECEAKFRLKAELRKHKIMHSVKNPFKCEECGSIFRLKSHLQQHKKIHLITTRSYKCELCDSTFRQLTHLTQHKKSHTSEKPFKCQLCPSAFRVRSNLRRHELGHIKKGEIVPQYSVENVSTKTALDNEENTESNTSVLSGVVKPSHEEIATEWIKILRPRKESISISDNEDEEIDYEDEEMYHPNNS